jgi:hypothetical protein
MSVVQRVLQPIANPSHVIVEDVLEWVLVGGWVSLVHRVCPWWFVLVYHYAATKCLVHSGVPLKIIGLYCDLLFACLVFVSVKPRKQTHVREGGIARHFLIYVYVVCIFYVFVFVPIRSWHQEQKFGPRS